MSSYECAALFHPRGTVGTPCVLVQKRKVWGEWVYLARFPNGNAQWIGERLFDRIDGDVRKLPRYKGG